ncbi:MAG: LysR family transcriptional regulator [Burkholderiales bacterium]|nr:MAG: LysR family transcriptional regulator [Burkholderiales bacterium]
MDLNDLHTFTRVVELGSLSGAAREADVPVSQISRSLARLEALHKVRLLHRSTHALSLTEAGLSLLEHGKRMLESYAQFEADVSDGAEVSGMVKLAASPAMAQYVIVPSLESLAQKYPKLAVELNVDDRAVDMAQQGIDLAIRTGDPGSDNLVARKIGEHGRRLYATPGYIAVHGMPKSLEDLAQHRLITNSAQPILNRWPFIINGQRITHIARGHYRANSSDSVMAMAFAGLGIVRSNTAICEPVVARGQLVRVMDELVDCQTVPINAVMLQERHRAPKIRACIDFFAQWLAQH